MSLKPLKPGMGLYQVMKGHGCPASSPHAVVNLETGDVNGRCHPSRAKALAQLRAMYATLGEKAKVHSEMGENVEASVIRPTKEFSEEVWIDGNKKWVKVYPYTSWSHPLFTDTEIDPEVANALKDSFDNKVYSENDLVLTYDHGLDKAKGGKAAGWFRELDVRDDGLYSLVEFTDTAKQEVDAGEWRYFSGEHYDEYTHPHTGETHNLVFKGGALTNKPWVKEGMLPLNFSEIYVERESEPSGKAESITMKDDVVVDEAAPSEHADPGQVERLDERNDDDAAESGSRVDTPPNIDVDARLREVLGLDSDADIVKAVSDIKAEVAPLREAAKAHSEAKQFAELFPDEHRRLQELSKRDVENRAKAFSESFNQLEDADGRKISKELPAVVQDKLEDVYKRFSEGSGNITDLGEVVELMAKTGLVETGERGSSREADVVNDPAKAFAEKVMEYREKDSLDHTAATKRAIEEHPDLFQGYRESVSHRR